MLLVASLLQAVYAEESSQSQEQCNDCDEYSADYKKVDDGRFFKKPYYSHPAQEAETEVKATPDPINLDSGFDPVQNAKDEIARSNARLAQTNSAQAQDINPQTYAEMKQIAAVTGRPIDAVFADPKSARTEQAVMQLDWASLAKSAEQEVMRNVEIATPTPEPELGSKEWLKNTAAEVVDESNKIANIIMPTITAAITISLFAFFLIFSISPKIIKEITMKKKIRLVFSPFFPSLIILFFADMLPDFDIDGVIDYDARYYVMVFVFCLACWIVWRRTKEKQVNSQDA